MKSHSAHSMSPKFSQRSPLPDEGPAKKPAIVGSQSTAVAVQLMSRPSPNPHRVSSIATSCADSPRTCPSSLKYDNSYYIVINYLIYKSGGNLWWIFAKDKLVNFVILY